MKKLIFLLLAMVLTACASGQPDTLQTEISFGPSTETTPPKPSAAAEKHREICDLVDAVAQKYGAMGVQVAVV